MTSLDTPAYMTNGWLSMTTISWNNATIFGQFIHKKTLLLCEQNTRRTILFWPDTWYIWVWVCVCVSGCVCVCVLFCIHLHVWKGRKLIPVLSDSCVQKPIISWKMTKRWQNIPFWCVCGCVHVCVCVWTSITVEIFYPGSRDKALTQREGTR